MAVVVPMFWCRFLSVLACTPDPSFDNVDLVSLWVKCPHLLSACVDGEVAVFRNLRQLSKEAQSVVSRAHLKAYTVRLRKEAEGTHSSV